MEKRLSGVRPGDRSRRAAGAALLTLLVLLSLAAAFSAGLAIGGYTESLQLRRSLEAIPDLNPCHP